MSSEITNFHAKDENTLSPNQMNIHQLQRDNYLYDYKQSSNSNSNCQDDTQSLQSFQIKESHQPLTQRVYSNHNNQLETQSNIQTQSVALESFYLSSNVKVLIGVNEYIDQQQDEDIEQETNQFESVTIDPRMQSVNLNFNGNLYKQYQFYHTFEIQNNLQQIFDLILSQSLQCDSIGNYVTTIMTYGQKSSGKSQLLGTLFENQFQNMTMISQTLRYIFEQQLQLLDEEQTYEVHVSCYEVFLETLCDLFDETNEEFQTENDVTWLPVHTLEQSEQLLKMAFLNRKQIADENGLSFSQSHLIVNIRVTDQTSEGQGKIYTFIDLVGFDEEFTEKIMNGSSFAIHNESIINNQQDSQCDDERLQKVIRDCNDNNLYSIRNLLLAIENEKDSSIQQVLEETTLARVIFAKLLQSNNFYVIGTLNKQQQHFNECLNTLEFCTKFQQALMNQQQNILPVVKESSLQYYNQEENMIATDESKFMQKGALPQEISAYLDCNIKQANLSKFYQPNDRMNNQSIIQNRILSESLYAQTLNKKARKTTQQQNQSHISMNSGKMLKYLDKFLYKQTYGQSELSSNNLTHIKPAMFRSRNAVIQNKQKESAIKIQNDFLLDQSQSIRPLKTGMIQQIKNSSQKHNLKQAYQPQSERSTGFATNTQITHLRKYSQDLLAGGQSSNNLNNGNKQSISQFLLRTNTARQNLPDTSNQLTINEQGKYQPQILEKTFSELNFNQSKTQDLYHNLQTSQNQVFNLKNINNYSKIMGNNNKSKYDSSFLSTFINHGNMSKMQTQQNIPTQHQQNQLIQDTVIQDNQIIFEEEDDHHDNDELQIQMAINQFKQAKDVIAQAVNQRSRSQLKSRMQNLSNANQSQSNAILGYNQLSQNQQSSLLEQQKVSKATLFVGSIIRESMKALDTQMTDFTTFFVKDKNDDNCFVCKSSNSNNVPESNIQDVIKQKKARFFDLDKILKEIEMKELRQQTIQSISNSQNNSASHHKKNTKSTHITMNLNVKSQQLLDIPKPNRKPPQKQQLQRQRSFEKEKDLAQQQLQTMNMGHKNNHMSTQNLANIKDFSQMNMYPQQIQKYDMGMKLNRKRQQNQFQESNLVQLQDQNALNELLTIINNSIDTRKYINKTPNI